MSVSFCFRYGSGWNRFIKGRCPETQIETAERLAGPGLDFAMRAIYYLYLRNRYARVLESSGMIARIRIGSVRFAFHL
jgi:hypothetical protein